MSGFWKRHLGETDVGLGWLLMRRNEGCYYPMMKWIVGVASILETKSAQCERLAQVTARRVEDSAPKEIRTPVLALKGPCPGPLDDGGWAAMIVPDRAKVSR
jgi:hypothetical protein